MKTTGIGSLPHHNVDSALDYSFRHDIPFLPQLPFKSPKELMVYQTLFGFPGLELRQKDAVLNLKLYLKSREESKLKIQKAFKENHFRDFLPTPEEYSAFAPFLFELQERNVTHAKIQITGPETLNYVLTLNDGESIRDYSLIKNDILEFCMVKGFALIEAIKELGIRPIIFIDEPILSLIKPSDTLFVTALSDLTILINSFKKMGAKVGLHCCGNTDWASLLKLNLDYLSFDYSLSSGEIKKASEEMKAFKNSLGHFSLGILPTDLFDGVNETISIDDLKTLKNVWGTEILLTCACGLGLKSAEKAEKFLAKLKDLKFSLQK
jgi:methionine synthase II (cobalamin-independent)